MAITMHLTTKQCCFTNTFTIMAEAKTKSVSKALQLDPSNDEITVLEIGTVGQHVSFTSENGEVKEGHYFTFRRRSGGKLFNAGTKFISDKYLKNILNGVEYTPAVAKTLAGAKIEFTGLVEVPMGADYITSEGTEVTADKKVLLYNDMNIMVTVTAAEAQKLKMNKYLDYQFASSTPEELAQLGAELGF